MPNDLNRNNHLIDADNDKSSRKKLASSGFTASVWTLSGVVLAACGSLDNLFSDGGGGGARGNSVSVNASPVQQARVYFDMDGDGSVGANDIALQDQQYPNGFITDSRGLAHNIPEELYGRPFMAILDGAFDSDTGQKLDGEYRSVPGEDGRHSIASPITDLIVQVENSPNEDVEDVLTRILNDEGGGSYSPKEIQEIAEALLIPENYLDASGAPVVQVVQGLAKYLADNKAKQEAGQGYDEAEDYTALAKGAVAVVDAVEEAMLSPNPVVILNEDMDEDEPEVQVEFVMGEHDSYVGIINAISTNGAPVRFEIVGDASENYDGPYLINERGVINVDESRRAEIEPGITNLQVRVSAGNDHAPTYVDVEINVDPAPQIHIFDRDYGFGQVTAVGVVYENSHPQDSIVLDNGADQAGNFVSGIIAVPNTIDYEEVVWVIRDSAPLSMAGYFELVRAPDGLYALALKEGATLDYESILGSDTIDIYGMGEEYYAGGVINLEIAMKEGENGVLSNFLDVQVVVRDVPEAEFSGDFTAYVVEDERVENDHITARGVVTIAEEPGGDRFTDADRFTIWDYDRTTEAVEANGIYTMTLDHGTFTYNLASGEWVYSVENAHDDVQSMNVVDSFSDIFIFEATNYDGTTAERAVYLNVLGTNEHIHLHGRGNANSDDAAEFSIGTEYYSYTTSRTYIYELHLDLITADPDGVDADGYTYTWYRHDPGRAPVVVQEDRTLYPASGGSFFNAAKDYYAISLHNNDRLETGSYFSVDVSYTDTAGNDHVVTATYLGDKTYVDTIVAGTDDFDGDLNLGIAVPEVTGRGFHTSQHNINYLINTRRFYNDLFKEVSDDVEYRLVDTGAAYERLFYLNADNELIFTGNARDVAALGSGVELQLEVRVPDDTTETLTHTIVVDVSGSSIFDWATEAEYVYYRDEVRIFRRQVVEEIALDSDGRQGSYNYEWQYIDAPADIAAGRSVAPGTVGGSQNWYLMSTEQQDAVANRGAQLSVTITYTDGAGNQESVRLATPTLFFHLNDAQEVTIAEGDWGTTDDVAYANTTTRNPNANIRYELTKNPDDLFVIDAATSTIRFAEATTLDYENPNEQKRYVLEVTATDTTLNAGNTATQTIIINIGNAEDGDAEYAVRGVVGDGEVLRAVLATPDPDGGMEDIRYQWFIGEDAIDGATGASYTIGTANLYEDYSVVISYNDAVTQEGDDPRQAPAAVKAPIFAARADNYAPLIPENREGALLTIEATYDGEAAGISYALIGADAALFEIDASSGVISLVSGAELDYATATQHSFTVQATYTDDDDRSFTKLVDVTIDVGELVNDDAPELTAITDAGRARHDRTAPEDGVDTGIRLSVSDADIDEINQHVFSISQDDKFEVREINGEWGVFLKEGVSIDFDALNTDSITLTVTITDTLDDGTTPTDDVDVTIARYNSLSWDEDAGTQRFWLPEGNKEAGAAVANVAASSAEAGDVSYAFADGTLTSGFFSINAETGAITYTDDTRLSDRDAHQFILNVVASHATNGDVIEAQITIDVENIDLDIYGTVKDPGTAEFALARSTGLGREHFLEVTEIAPDPDGSKATHVYQSGEVREVYKYTWYMKLPGEDATVLHDDFERHIVGSGNVKFAAGNDFATTESHSAMLAEGAEIYVEIEYTDGADNRHVVTVDYPGGASHLDTIILGTHDLDGSLNLGNALPRIGGRRDPDGVVEYELVDTGAAYESLFQLNDAGELIFTGNTRDAATLGDGVELQLAVRVPEETPETYIHNLQVDVTGQVEHASFAVERYNLDRHHIWGVKILQDDPDGAFNNDEYITGDSASATIQWGFFYPDDYRYGTAGEREATPRRYVLSRDQIEALDDGAYVTATITYTDNAGNRHVVETAQTADFEIENFASPGTTLRVAQVRKDDYGVASVTYRWFEQDPDGANREYIGDTSSNTYTLDNMNAAKVYGVVVEYTSNNHGASFTLDKGSAIELIANSVVFDKAVYEDRTLHDFAGEGFDDFDPTPYFGDASNDDLSYQFAPGSSTDNGNSIRIKAGSDNTIIEEIKYIDGNAQISDLLVINTDTGDISYAGDTYLDATNFRNNPDQSKIYTIMVRGIYDADGDGVDADDPHADVSYVITVSGKQQAGGRGEAQIPDRPDLTEPTIDIPDPAPDII